jgi:hypothetical protein
MALGITLILTLAGCVGYVGPDGGAVIAPGPDVVVGGVWEGGFVGRDYAHRFGDRGHFSRGVAHGGGGHGGGRR